MDAKFTQLSVCIVQDMGSMYKKANVCMNIENGFKFQIGFFY